MTIEFKLSEKELSDAIEWKKEHNKTCPLINDYGRISYEFRPVGIGTICIIKCACGALKDITNVDSW